MPERADARRDSKIVRRRGGESPVTQCCERLVNYRLHEHRVKIATSVSPHGSSGLFARIDLLLAQQCVLDRTAR